jgi:hypothetical protein
MAASDSLCRLGSVEWADSRVLYAADDDTTVVIVLDSS